MAQYIDKAALVAEIEKLKAYLQIPNAQLEAIKVCDNVISVINTLETKEVDEEYNGKAMLHVLEKGVKQGKRELIDRACEWLRDNLHHYWGSISADPHNFLFDFRKAMEE